MQTGLIIMKYLFHRCIQRTSTTTIRRKMYYKKLSKRIYSLQNSCTSFRLVYKVSWFELIVSNTFPQFSAPFWGRQVAVLCIKASSLSLHCIASSPFVLLWCKGLVTFQNGAEYCERNCCFLLVIFRCVDNFLFVKLLNLSFLVVICGLLWFVVISIVLYFVIVGSICLLFAWFVCRLFVLFCLLVGWSVC